MAGKLADHLPILDRGLARGGASPVYPEREIRHPVDLCDARGRLSPDAVGFSRQPLVRANLSGRWPPSDLVAYGDARVEREPAADVGEKLLHGLGDSQPW